MSLSVNKFSAGLLTNQLTELRLVHRIPDARLNFDIRVNCEGPIEVKERLLARPRALLHQTIMLLLLLLHLVPSHDLCPGCKIGKPLKFALLKSGLQFHVAPPEALKSYFTEHLLDIDDSHERKVDQ